MRTAAALALAGMATLAFAQESNIYDVKFKYEAELRKLPGVQDVSVAGLNGELRLVVRVNSTECQANLLKQYGPRLDGFPIHIIVASAAAASSCAQCPCPCHRRPHETVAERRKPDGKFDLERLRDPSYAAEECDVLRENLGRPLRKAPNGIRCRQMFGQTNDPQRMSWVIQQNLPHWDSKDMPALTGTLIPCSKHIGGHRAFLAYTYIQHRQYCPLGMQQILQSLFQMTPR